MPESILIQELVLMPFSDLLSALPEVPRQKAAGIRKAGKLAFDYTREILTQSASAVGGVIDDILHPLDNVIYPISSLLYDATIITAGSTDLASFPETLAPELDLTQRAVQANPTLYYDAVHRMHERVRTIQAQGQHFAQANGPERAGMLSYGLTPVLVPGLFVKAAKAAKSFHQYGVASPPPSFHRINPDAALGPPAFPTFLTLKEVRVTGGIKSFNFVLTQENKLFISELHYRDPITRYPTESIIMNEFGMKLFSYEMTQVSHADMAKLVPVFDAGTFTVENGFIQSITNYSTKYFPGGPHLNKLTEKAFRREGYTEARGKYNLQSVDDLWAGMRKMTTPHLSKPPKAAAITGGVLSIMDALNSPLVTETMKFQEAMMENNRTQLIEVQMKPTKATNLQGYRDRERERERDRHKLDSLRPYVDYLTQDNRNRIAKIEKSQANLSANTLSHADMERFLLNHSVSPADITAAINDSEIVNVLQAQLQLLQRQDAELQLKKTQDQYLSAFQGGELIFGTLSQLGARLQSPALVTAGKTGVLAMQMAKGIEMYSACFSGAAAATSLVSMVLPAGLIAAATFGFIDLLFNNKTAPNQLNQISELIGSLSQRLDAHISGIHSQLDAIAGGIVQLGGMMHQSLQNQEKIYRLQHATYELVGRCFGIMDSGLRDLRSEQKASYEHIRSELRNLHDLGELNQLIAQEEKVTRKIAALIALERQEGLDPSVKALRLVELLSHLSSHIQESSSPNWNGARKYALIRNKQELSIHYLYSRFQSGDYALGPLAEEFEEITKTKLQDSGIKKESLFANTLWEQAAVGYLKISQLPSFKELDCLSTLTAIEEQAENAVKFMRHIGNSTVLFRRLIQGHQEYCHEFQFLVCQLTAGKEYKKGLGRPEAKDNLASYFSDGAERVAIERLCSKIDKVFLLLQQFALLGGLSAQDKQKIAALSTSETLLQQSFCFTDRESLTDYVSHLWNSSYLTSPYVPQEPYTGFDTVGGQLVEGKIIQLTISNYPSSFSAAHPRLMIDVGLYDVKAHRSQRTVFDSAGQPNHTLPIPFDYKKSAHRRYDFNRHQGANENWYWSSSHTWKPASYWYVGYPVPRHTPPHLVVMTGGNVALFDLEHKDWLDCDNQHTPAVFAVPNTGGGGLKITYNSLVVLDTLIINSFDWHSSPTHVLLNVHAFDLFNRHWIEPSTDPQHFFPRKNFKLTKELVKTPNQLFYQVIDNHRLSSATQYIVGLVVIAQEKLHLNIVSKSVPNPVYRNNALYKENWKTHPWSHFPIEAQEISQLKSTVLQCGKEKLLLLVASIKTKDNHHKLVFFKQSIGYGYFDRKFEFSEYLLPEVNEVADLQAIQLAPVTLGGRDYLLVTLLSPDFRFLVFCFDPQTKQVIQLPNGPFAFKEAPVYANNQKPLKSLSIAVAYVDEMAMLYFIFPVLVDMPGQQQPQWKMNITPYKLAPCMQASFEAIRLDVVSPTAALSSAPSGFSLSILGIQLLAKQQKARIEQYRQAQDSLNLSPENSDEEEIDSEEEIATIRAELARTNLLLEQVLNKPHSAAARRDGFFRGNKAPLRKNASSSAVALDKVECKYDASGKAVF